MGLKEEAISCNRIIRKISQNYCHLRRILNNENVFFIVGMQSNDGPTVISWTKRTRNQECRKKKKSGIYRKWKITSVVL